MIKIDVKKPIAYSKTKLLGASDALVVFNACGVALLYVTATWPSIK